MRLKSLIMAHTTGASLVVVAPLLLFYSAAKAAPLSSRSVDVGSSIVSANTNHFFQFTFPGVASVGSIEFEYCTNSPQIDAPCSAPAGLDLTGATLTAQNGETGFSIDASSSSNRLVLTRAPSMTSAIPASYNFTNIINQSTPNQTAYVRIATYGSSDATGPVIDEGAVAYATVNLINVSGFVPPYLTFCVGVTVALNCSSATGSQLSFGELSKTSPNAVSSQFSVATNDPTGYSTTIVGTTMTSGNNIIPALATPAGSQPGVSQFGINLVGNANPSIGANPAGVGTGTPSPNYSTPNQFSFNNNVVALSPLPTEFTAFTVSYLANVSTAQPAGVYTTTLTYITTVSF